MPAKCLHTLSPPRGYPLVPPETIASQTTHRAVGARELSTIIVVDRLVGAFTVLPHNGHRIVSVSSVAPAGTNRLAVMTKSRISFSLRSGHPSFTRVLLYTVTGRVDGGRAAFCSFVSIRKTGGEKKRGKAEKDEKLTRRRDAKNRPTKRREG